MKQLNFNDKRILKALLDKSKTTTIRKAWENNCVNCKYFTSFQAEYDDDPYEPDDVGRCDNKLNFGKDISATEYFICKLFEEQYKKDKPCKYKLGEIVEAVWTGGIEAIQDIKDIIGIDDEEDNSEIILGEVKITKIEKIEISRSAFEIYMIQNMKTKRWMSPVGIIRLSKSEGFKNPEKMFRYIEVYAGTLEEPKPFWLISFEWLK